LAESERIRRAGSRLFDSSPGLGRGLSLRISPHGRNGRCHGLARGSPRVEASDPDDFGAVVAGLAKLRSQQYHREPLSKALGGGLFELRHVGKLNTRVLWFFMKDRRIVGVHGIRNKGQAIPAREPNTIQVQRSHTEGLTGSSQRRST
jgi:hypothetical protein